MTSISPAVEYDFFPYSESAERSLTLHYSVGASRYSYSQITLYDKLEETMPRHILTASLGFRQPWGTAGASATFWQSLSEPSFNRQSLLRQCQRPDLQGAVRERLGQLRAHSRSVLSGEARSHRGGDSAPARQLATGHRFYLNFGFTYSFGSLSNATVNPRFGG